MVEEHVRDGRLPSAEFGDRWIFPSSLLIEAIAKIAQLETENRQKPARPFGVLVSSGPKKKRTLAGLDLMHPEVAKAILEGQ